MHLTSGHTAQILEGEELAQHQGLFKGFTEGLVRLLPDRWLVETSFLKFANRIYDFKFKKDDVLVMTHPKCGTTWIQELVWTMKNNPSLDHPLAKTPVNTRSPYIEGDTLGFGRTMPSRTADDPMLASFFRTCPGGDPSQGVFIQIADATPDPRILMTHLPFSLIPPSVLDTTKVVYMVRNPKDVCVSFDHHCRLMLTYGYTGSFDEFVQRFVDDDLIHGPFWTHVKEAWQRRSHPNLHFMFYEDLKEDLLTTLTGLDEFLGTGLTQDQLKKIGEYCSIDKMRERSSAVQASASKNKFYDEKVLQEEGSCFRKGIVGDWKNKLTPQQEEKIVKWTRENCRDMDISFKYSL